MNERLHRIYYGMKTRCCNPNNHNYKGYGDRGITICDEWLHNSKSFYKWALNNGYADNLSIDRIDNNKGYCPENCRWATRKEQNNNQRTNRLITYQGKTLTLKQWCDLLGLNYGSVKSRLNKYHYPVEKLFSKYNNNFHMISYKGKTLSIKEWSCELNIPYKTLLQRLSVYHWSVERAFTTEVRKKC